MSSSSASEQKKRALDALNRRITAEANLVQHQSNLKSININIDANRNQKPNLKSKAKKLESKPAHNATILTHNPASSMTGQAILSGSILLPETTKSSSAEVHPVYNETLEDLDDRLIQASVNKDSSSQDVVSKIVNDIVSKGEQGNKFAKGGKRLKIDNWILLDNFVAKDDTLKNVRLKALKSHSKRSRFHMSKRQHRKCGSFDLPKEFHNFDLYKPIYEYWKEYIDELLKERGKKKLAECLLSADLHGSFVLVVECKTTALKGISGILIRETAETFGIITQENLFRVVPKIGSIFMFHAGCWKITLLGEKISERILNKKSSR